MEQLKAILNSLSWRQKLTILSVAIAVGGGLLWLSHWNKERDFKPLYTSLAPEDAGAVAARLREAGVEFRVTDGGTSILVPSASVAETRIQMAAAGLPKTGRIGYELFDKNNFGVTEFTEQINYHRALEGELERSIMAVREVEQARVHVTLPKNSLFLEQRQPAKASVMVKLRAGAKLAPQNVVAITHLVASAVEGLTPEGVSVLDMSGQLLSKPHRTGDNGIESSDAALEYRQKIEKDLLAKVSTTLEPVLGPDKFRVGISVDCDFSTGEQSEESFDPSRSVMVTSSKTEDISGLATASGVPGTASNLPRPTSRPGSGSSGVTRRTENITYASSRLVKRMNLPQGGIKRMSVSVLLDQQVRWEGTGPKATRIIEPPSAEKLKVIRDLVAGVIGLQAERGDQLVVESLPFEQTLSAEPPPTPSSPAPAGGPDQGPLPAWLKLLLDDRKLPIYAGIAAGVLLALLTLFAVLRKLRRKKAAKVEVAEAAREIEPAAAAALADPESVRKQLEEQVHERMAEKELQMAESLASLKLPPVKTQRAEVLSKHLSGEAKKDPHLIAGILRSWLTEKADA